MMKMRPSYFVALLAGFFGCGSVAAFENAAGELALVPGTSATVKVTLNTTGFVRGPYEFVATTDAGFVVTVTAHPANSALPNVVDTRGGIEKAEVRLEMQIPEDLPVGSVGEILVRANRLDGATRAETKIPFQVVSP